MVTTESHGPQRMNGNIIRGPPGQRYVRDALKLIFPRSHTAKWYFPRGTSTKSNSIKSGIAP